MSSDQPKEADIRSVMELNYSRDQATQALKIHKNKEQAINSLLTSTTEKALYSSFEPLNPLQRQRQEGSPVGLKNLGSTCYFNSLIQAYFMIPSFVQQVMAFSDPEESKQSTKLMLQLQRLFAYMIRSNKKYIDPSLVLNYLVDDLGNPIEIGDEKDIGEFNMMLVERLEEALNSRDQVNKSLEQGRISQLFYGKHTEELSYFEKAKQVVTGKSSAFGQINIDIEQKDLYSGWASAYENFIEGYLAPEGQLTQAFQRIWIEKLPQILLFGIQRVKYDTELGLLKKVHKAFNFPKVIYPDRFLVQNKTKSLEIMNSIKAHQKRIKLLQEKLEKFERFKDSQIPLSKVLELTSLFLSDNIQSSTYVDLETTDSLTPESLELFPQLPQLQSALSLVDQCSSVVNQKVDSIKQEIQTLSQEVEGLFDSAEMKKHPYLLHAVLVHEGGADRGHYFTYIFDQEHQLWRKFNDIHTSVVSESQVMEHALGGKGLFSAYSLVYVDPSLVQKSDLTRSYLLFKGKSQEEDWYNSLIPENLKEEVDLDNFYFTQETQEFKVNSIIKEVQQLYLQRLSTLSRVFHEFKGEEPYQKVINIALHFRRKGENFLYKWVVLNNCVREVEPSNRGLLQLDSEEVLCRKLELSFVRNCKEAPQSIFLNSSQKETLIRETKMFIKNYCDGSICLTAFECLNSDKIKQAMDCVCNLLSGFNSFGLYADTMLKILVLRITSLVNGCLNNNKAQDAISWAKYLNYACCVFLDRSDVYYRQVESRLKASAEWASNHLSEGNELNSVYQKMLKAEFDENFCVEQVEGQLIKGEEWIEGWNPGSLAMRLREEISKIDTSSIKPWYTLQKRIEATNRVLSEPDLRKWEESVINHQYKS